jgi:hypothetical protein
MISCAARRLTRILHTCLSIVHLLPSNLLGGARSLHAASHRGKGDIRGTYTYCSGFNLNVLFHLGVRKLADAFYRSNTVESLSARSA